MYESNEQTVKLRSAWRAGEASVAAGRWWEAHEHFEVVWRALPASAQASSVRAVIQLCAALHKPQQAADERARRHDLCAGMLRLIDRASRGWQGGPPELGTWFAQARAAAEQTAAAWTDRPPSPPNGVPMRIPDDALVAWWEGAPGR